MVRQRLRENFVHLPDPFWGLQSDSREWNSAQVHAVGEKETIEKAADAKILKDSIDHWLNAR
jgi:hypothetical protein